MNREGIKTLILTLLVISSIIFTQKIWLYNPMELAESRRSIFSEDSQDYAQIKSQIMIPKNITIAFGNSFYTRVEENIMDIWYKIIPVLENYFLGDIQIQQVDGEKYRESSRLKSVELEFGDNIPSVLISSIFNTVDNKIVSNIEEIKKILIISPSRGIIYIKSSHGDVYEIRLDRPDENKLNLTLIDDIRDSEHIRYYPLFGDAGNDIIMPIDYNRPIEMFFVESQINPSNEVETQESVKTFFNNSLDFVKTIKETSGALVYMYGYGEKGVRISSKGRLEYTEEHGQTTTTNVLSALDTSIEFMLQHDQLLDGLYLEEIDHMGDKGYFFGFGYRINNMPVTFNNDKIKYPIEIKVYGDRVKEYKNFVRKAMELPKVNSSNKIILPQQIIEKHIDLIQSYYLIDNKDIKIPEEEVLSYMEKSINNAEIMYYDTIEDGTRQLFSPIWKIQIDRREYYFDSYNAELLYTHLVD